MSLQSQSLTLCLCLYFFISPQDTEKKISVVKGVNGLPDRYPIQAKASPLTVFVCFAKTI